MRFETIKNDILGKDYSLSLAYISAQKMRAINKKYRKKDKSTNVLSFNLQKNEGELLLCKEVIKKEAKNLKKSYREWLTRLVIHGMLHLKGMAHGSKMERAEKFYFQKHDTKHFNRDRRGISHDKSHRGRILKRRKKS